MTSLPVGRRENSQPIWTWILCRITVVFASELYGHRGRWDNETNATERRTGERAYGSKPKQQAKAATKAKRLKMWLTHEV